MKITTSTIQLPYPQLVHLQSFSFRPSPSSASFHLLQLIVVVIFKLHALSNFQFFFLTLLPISQLLLLLQLFFNLQFLFLPAYTTASFHHPGAPALLTSTLPLFELLIKFFIILSILQFLLHQMFSSRILLFLCQLLLSPLVPRKIFSLISCPPTSSFFPVNVIVNVMQ